MPYTADEQFPSRRREAIRVAKELRYSPRTIERLSKATGNYQLTVILSQARSAGELGSYHGNY